MFTRALVTLASVVPCFCKVYENVAHLPGLSYDFVIVGGGAAGNVVANRLTENPKISVLVLEAGLSNEDVIDSIVPFFDGDLLAQSIYDWNYTTVPQPGLNGRNIAIQRAFMLGGCTSHNFMIYARGSAEDYDRFAAVTGDPGWSWDRLLPYFFKNEKWTEPADHHDTRGQFNPAVHSTKGINSVSLAGFPWPIFSQHVIEATRELPEEWPFNLDTNSGNPLGLGWLQSTIGGGKRSSSATSYLGPQFIRRKNLHVLLHAQATKLVNPSHVGGKVAFGGVQFAQGGVLFTAKAVKEIILSAGAVGTPNILLHSGIGDSTALTNLGIKSLIHLPSVGRNASDQPMFNAAQWLVNSTQTLDSIYQNTTRFNEAYEEWNRTHTGLFATQGGPTHLGWRRLDPESFASNNFTDPSAGPNSPHFQAVFIPLGFQATGNGVTAGIINVNPVSRGSVTINSSNPLDSPIVDFGFLQSEIDLFIIRQAVSEVLRFFKASTWENYLIAPVLNLENLSDDALDELIRNSAVSVSHFVGTAAMSARNGPYGVVDPDLLVKGAKGVRIIDASVFPFVPSANTQAGTYVIAERGADLVKASWE